MALCALMVGCAPGGGKPAGGLDSGLMDSGGASDCEAPSVWYADVDGDGFGDAAAAVLSCDAPEGSVADAADCDDGNASIYPGAPEVCNDGGPNDCADSGGAAADVSCPSGGPFSLWGSDALLLGEADASYAGLAVARAGDVNGDRLDDLLVAAPYWGAGVAYLILSPVGERYDLADSDAWFTGAREGDQAGWSLSGAGDQDGDMLPDLLIGVPERAYGGQGGVYLFSGLSSGEAGLADADAAFQGIRGDDEAGAAVAGLGDTNGDGWDDVLIGAPGVEGLAVESDAGRCSAEDDDYGSGEGRDAGASYLVRGPTSGAVALGDADAVMSGEDANDYVGTAVAQPGDIDGDGVSDLILGGYGNCAGGQEAGAAYLLLGPISGSIYLGDADGKVAGEGAFGHAGKAVSEAGDVDGDGTPDILVGAPDLDGPDVALQGAAYLVLGPARGYHDLADAHAKIRGERAGVGAGRSLSSAGDVDHDGFDDMVIGAFLSGPDHTYPGAAYVVMGPVSGVNDLADEAMTFVGEDDDYAGWSVAGVGDTNLDGLPDLWIGMMNNNIAGTGAGAAALILGGGPAFTGTWGP